MLVTGYADLNAFSPAEGDLVLQQPYRLDRLASSVAEALQPAPSKAESNVVPMNSALRAVKSG